MRHFLILNFAIFLSFAAIAQTKVAPTQIYEPHRAYMPLYNNVQVSSSAPAPAPFWSNTFSNPQQDWITFANPANQDWVIGTTAPSGGFSVGMGAISSTSAADGFALFDSDALAVSAQNTQDATLTYKGVIDCSNIAYVNINFESYHRKFQDSVFVEVTNDGWLTYERYEVHVGQAINTSSSNPENISVNISSVAGNQDSVTFRFRYEGQWDYAWMVDDVSFTETPNNEIKFGEETFGGWWIQYANSIGFGSDFTAYPLAQATAMPYRFEGVISNTGVITQNNFTMNVNVEEMSSGTVYPFSSNGLTLTSTQRDTVQTSNGFTPMSQGQYNISFWATSDSAITDTVVKTTIVTDTVYAVDYDWNFDGANASGYYDLGRNCGGNILANTFDIFEATYATSISFFVNDRSVAGASVKVGVYEIDPAVSLNTSAPVLLASSDPYELKLQDINSWVTLKLTTPLSLTPGSWLAAVQGFSSFTDTTFIGANGNSNSVCYQQDNCPPTPPNTNPAGTWVSLNGSPMIRLNVSKNPPLPPPNSIEEGLRNFNIFPNPTNGYFTLELDKISNYDVFVKNMLGQTIYTTKVSSLKSDFDFSNYKKGVYTIELKDNDITYIEKIILE
tara:strand:- start:105 stop:1955 length:1851 start_codon:yes stop_codon:yes gene_type:complete